MDALLEWWNFMFAVPLAVGLLLAVTVAVTGLGAGDGAEYGPGDGVGADAPADDAKGPLSLLSFLGFGRGVPAAVLLPLLLVTSGLVGLLSNASFGSFVAPPALAWLSSALAFVAAGASGRLVAEPLGALLSPRDRNAKRGALVGRPGVVAYAVSSSGGVVDLRDDSGSLHRVLGRSDGPTPLPAGTAVVASGFDSGDGAYLVRAEHAPAGAPPHGRRAEPGEAAPAANEPIM